MSRIDSIVATQVAEVARPVQTSYERAQQSQAAQVASTQAPTGKAVSADDLRASMSWLKQVVESASARKLSFKVDDESGQMFVEITDQSSGEVIRQLPSEEVLRLHKNMEDLVGILLNKQA